MNLRNKLFSYGPVVLAMLFWSYSFIWYKQVFLYYDPVTLIAFRLIIAVPLLFILSVSFRKLQRVNRKHFTWFLLLAFFEPFLYFLGECYGVNLITPTLASIMISLIPLLVPIPAWYLFREKFTITNYIGLFISIGGVVLVIMGEHSGQPTSFAGVMLMMVAILAAVFHSVFVRKLAEHYNTFTIVTYQNTLGLIYFLPLFFIMSFSRFVHTHHTFEMVLPVIKLAVFSSTFAFLFFVYSIQKIGMARTNVFINLIPVFTALLAFLVLNEKFGILKIAGIVVVIAGLVFSQYNYQARLAGNVK
ncbi:MAG: DMT family transporter [Bacteroidales bacterium]|nr:DMT family transporter [Bacteroidales bacterium]